MWKAPLFWHLVYAYIFFAQSFVKGACSLGIQWVDCYICLATSNKWVSQRAIYEWVNILDDQVYEWVCFFNGQVYKWGRFRKPPHTHTYTHLPPSCNQTCGIKWAASSENVPSKMRKLTRIILCVCRVSSGPLLSIHTLCSIQLYSWRMRRLIKAFSVRICPKTRFRIPRPKYECFINITKTCLYNFDPLKPHFYIVKMGFTGV